MWLVRIQPFCFIKTVNRFTCLAKSKPVKQEVSRIVILPLTKWVFSGWYKSTLQCRFLHEASVPAGAKHARVVRPVGDGVRLEVQSRDRQLHLRQEDRTPHSDDGWSTVSCTFGHRWTSRIRKAYRRRKRALLRIQVILYTSIYFFKMQLLLDQLKTLRPSNNS